MTKAYITHTGKVSIYDDNGQLMAAIRQPIEEIMILTTNRWGIMLKSQNGNIPGFLYADRLIMETT
jgi:hypothetical protein